MDTKLPPQQPIALVGRSLRFPGASSISELWDLLRQPRDLLQDVPPLRMNLNGYYHPNGDHDGTTNVRQSYFVKQDHRVFDAPFFHISPVEAEAMDPQQRILLELVYEALESAGMTIDGLQGSRTSVFVGVMSSDFASIQQRDEDNMPAYAVTGGATSILSNRISYFYDWKGASMTIDTACSSSLVAVHQAVQSLRNGESEMAVVAGTNLMLTPEPFIMESKLHMLSPNSQSAMWDAQANGYVRGEGFAVIILKALDQAVRNRDPIRSIIRESLVNTDGRTTGLTVPSSSAQASLIKATYQRAGLDCQLERDRCQYFEAHGTGTPTGDPVEAEAIATAFFPAPNPEPPAAATLYVGSIKTVVGHLEGCAGLAGLLKASLAVERGVIFPNLHFHTLNPAIKPFYRNLEIPIAVRPWPELPPGLPRRASVNSFGFGGANAHVILESYRQTTETPFNSRGAAGEESLPSQSPSPGPFVVSARSQTALLARVNSLSQHLQSHPPPDLGSLGAVLQSHRTVFSHRASFVGATLNHLLESMNEYSEKMKGNGSDNVHASLRLGVQACPRILGIFTGQGAQWPQMGRELILTSPVFAQTLAGLQRSLDALPDPPSWSLRQELTAESDLSRVSESEVAQPLCTAVQIGLVDVLRCAGIGFYKVVGHSSGEIAASYAAGYLSASDAIRVSYYRGLHVRHALQLGAMAAVNMAFDDATELCRSKAFAGRVVIAASNSSSNVTLSGDADAIQEVIELLGETTTVRRLRVNRAYHSHHMIPVAEPYLQSLRACNIKVRRDRPHCIWISSVTPDLLLSGDGLEGPYWAQNLVQPVLFELAVKTALRNVDEMERLDAIVEVGPHPALKAPVTQTVLEARLSIPYCAFLQRQRPAGESFARGLGELWVHLGEAAGIDFPGYRAAVMANQVHPVQLNPLLLEDLPAYPWDHQRVYWKESRVSINARLGGRSNHSLLGRRRPDDSAHEMRWRNILRLQDLPWLRGHSFQGETLLPAAGYVSMAFQAGQHLVPGRQVVSAEIHELEISHALVLRDDAFGMETTFGLQVVQRVDADTLTAVFVCSSCPNKPSAETQVNARGKIQISTAEGSGGLPPRDMATHSMLSMDVDRFYSTLAELGLGYTGPFSALNKIWRTTNMSTAHASWASSELDQSMLVHPAVLDTGFQAIFASAGSIFTLQHPYLPTKIDRIRIGEPPIVVPKQEEYVHMVANSFITKISRRFPDLMPVVRADVDVYSDHHYSLQVEGLTLTPISAADPLGDRCLFYQTVWDDDISNQPIKGLELIRQDERLLDDTELPELLERISHVYLRELYAKTPREKIPTFAWYHQRLFEYLDDTFACIDKGRHPVIKQEWTKDTRQQLFAELVRFPETIDLICANAVAENFLSVLEQKISMLQVLAADDRLSRLYDEGLVLDRGYSYIGLMAKRISHRYPRLKLFEIGAGTGATTRRILESMEGAFTSYTYTDISNGFFEKAKTRFVKHASKMEFRTFNVEKDPAEQGLSIHTYDVVIASGVLHATRCMRETLANTRRLLKPGGYLLLLEPTGSSLRVAYLMCGLPGWWLGGDDGRRLHPGLTPIQWDASLKEAGFSGVDTLWSDSDEPTKHVYSAILTQAVDERVMMIREPLSAMDSLPDITQLLIIGGNTLPVFKLLGEISALLHNWLNRIVRVASIEELSSSEPTALDGATVLCLSELDQPVFRSMTTETFQGMQRLFSHAKQVLWVTQGCRTGNPYSNMTIGIARVLLNEMLHLNVQMLDIQDSHLSSKSTARNITNCLLRLVMKQSLSPDVLWSTEPELALENGRLFIPRLLPDRPLNDRLNSNLRRIHNTVSAKTHAVQLLQQDGRYSLYKGDSINSLRDNPTGGQTTAIQVDLSSLHPLDLSPGVSLFVAIGRMLGTGQMVVVLTQCNASFICTKTSWTRTLDGPVDQSVRYLRSIIETFNAQKILRGLKKGSILLVHLTPSHSLAQTIARVAGPLGVQVVYISSHESLPESSHRHIYVHPRATMRQIKALLPANVDRFVQLETCRDDSVGKDLSSCLPDSTETVSLAHLFPDNAGVVATADVSLIGSLLDMVIREALTIKSIHLTAEPLHILSANSLADIPSPSRTNIVDWREQASYPIIVQPVDPSKLFSNDKTYLLVGLTGDLGQSLARWMVRHGSRHLVLSSRRGVVDAAWLEDMRTAGANISVRSMDIGDSQSLRSLLSEIQQTMPPIAGVVNGAMVLADAPFTAMTFQAMADVLKPKMHGSQHLDDFFRGSELDFFILLSSVSAVVGFPGQSNYAAANMFMKGLAARRRSQGLVGSVLDIGMLTEIGYVARAGPSLEKHLRHKFYCPPISEPDFHQLFVEAIQAGRPDSMHPPEVITGVQKLRESQLLDKHSWMYNPRFSHLFLEEPVATQQATSLHSIPISQQLANAETTEDAVMILQAEFIHRLATILQLSPSDINPQAALVHVGIDSLIAIELRSWFMKEVGVDIPALRMLSGSNTLELCEDVIMNFGLREDCEKSQSDLGKPEEQAKTQNIVMAVVESGNDAESMACSDYSEAAFASMNSDNRATDSADNETQSERSNSNGYLDITHDKKQIVLNEAVRDDLVYSEPMSYSQSRQWFLVASSPAPARYNVVLAYDIDGPLSIAGLQLAFQAVISRHQAFRTCFYMQVSTGKCMQGILQRSKAVLNCKMSTNDDDILEEFDHMRNHEFQLEQGDVFRATLMQRSQSQNTLIFGYSHILMDGTSVFLFLEDLNRAYRNEPWKLPVSPYTDFALSQRTLVENDSHRQELDYWKKSLLPLPPVLPLLDICRVRSRPTTPAPYGTHTVHASISESDVLRLKKLCQDLGITAFHFHLTVLRFLLTKFLTATNDYCIGIADANRIDHAFLRTIGNFFNLLPLRFSRQVGQSFQDAAKDTSRQSLLALSNSRLPFELLLEALNIPRSTSNTPLFQVFMNYRMAAFQHLSLGDCRMRHRAICDANIGYDLLITVTEPTRTSSVVSLTVRDDLYTQASAQLLLDAYRNLLNQFIQDPSQPLESCTLYSEMDVRSGINLGQGSQQECRLGQKTLVRHVEDWTSKTPGKIAVKDLYGNLLSFKALSHQSRTIAGILSTAGVTKASYVAVLMHPCSTTIAAILAILRLGAIYVPLDLGNPLERLIMIVRDCNPTAVLCQQNTVYLANKMATDGSVIVLNQLFLEDEDEAAHRDDSVDPDQPAFAFYTSGSTGTPKGVLISQANFLHAVDVTVQAACTTDKDVILQQSSLGFDLSLYQIIHSLACGATLIIAPPALRRNPRELAKLMLSEQVSITIATPSEYSIMLSYGMPNLQRCAKWRVAASSGENMTVPVKQLFSQLNSPILAVQNWFGPTEVGVYAINPCVRYQTSGETDLDEYPSIQPAPNVQVYIVDQDLQAVAPGFPGEICVGGPSTAQGYIGDHELTCQKFIRTTLPDVNHGLVENRVYRSGDKGRLLQDGTMVFLGRIQDDTMLKLHGFRIDLGELTTAILRTAGESLVDATATIRGNTPFLVAFVVFAPGRTPPDASASLADLARNLPLPDYMRPSVILPVPALPTTPNGKRDRVALDTIPLPVIGGVVEELPLSDVETALKDLWLQTLPGDLSTARITKDTSFFHVGGSSILLLKLQALVEKTFSVEITVMRLFQSNTLGDMAARIEAKLQYKHENTYLTTEIPQDQYPITEHSSNWDDCDYTASLPPLSFDEEVDWEEETIVHETVRQPITLASRDASYTGKTILLTGSTGLLGRALLARLVDDPLIRKIHCVAVPLLSEFRHLAKVKSYAGSLSMPTLGLSSKEAELLTQEVDIIIHASTEGSFLDSYQSIRQSTLGAVRYLASIAAPRSIPFHFLSSGRVILFTGAAGLPEISVAHFHPPTDGSEGLAAARWACERYLQNVSEALAVPVYIHRACALTSDKAPPSDVLNSIIRYTQLLKAVPILDKAEGFIDFMPLETAADEIIASIHPSSKAAQGTAPLRFIHHASGKRLTPPLLRKHFEDQEQCPFVELELTEWLRKAQALGLSDFAAAVIDSLRGREEPVFFPLLLKPPPSQNTSDSLAVRQETGATRNPTPLDMVS